MQETSIAGGNSNDSPAIPFNTSFSLAEAKSSVSRDPDTSFRGEEPSNSRDDCEGATTSL